MTYWETLTNETIADRFNPDEMAALTSMQGGKDQLSGVLTDTIDAVRGQIKAGGGQVGPDGMTPKSLKREIVSIVIWDWLTGYSKNDKLQTDARKNKYAEAIAKLEKIAKGELKVELPDPGQTDSQQAPVNGIALIRPGRHTHTRQFDGEGTS